MTVDLTALYSETLVFHLLIDWTQINKSVLLNIQSNYWRQIQLNALNFNQHLGNILYFISGGPAAVLWIAFYCCLYYIHTALCSFTAFRQLSSHWSELFVWPSGLWFFTSATLKMLLFLLLFRYTHSTLRPIPTPYHISPCNPLSRLPARCNGRRHSVCQTVTTNCRYRCR